MKPKIELSGRWFHSLSVFVYKECAESSYFDFDLKNTVYELHKYWTSMAAILAVLFL